MAWSESTQDGKLVHKKKRLAEVQEKIVELTARKRLCLFKSDRENDILSEALGNAEHTGHNRGVTPHGQTDLKWMKTSGLGSLAAQARHEN
jgi:hypothetical protein